MDSSDDEGTTLLNVISDYYFVGAEDEPLSFTELPVQWVESESLDDNNSQIFLRGTADNGLQKLYRPVKAWKCDLSKVKPEISALSRDNNWIKLLKPRKSFEDMIRTILITVHCLHFFKRKPEASGKSLWDHLCKVFSLYDIRPSENDLVDHLSFISEAVKRDKTLRKSEFLASFLEKKPGKRKALDENAEVTMKPSFIVDDMNGECGDEELTIKAIKECESDDEGDGFETVCAICDDGGDLTCCEGKCLRAFHATIESAESKCESLGLRAEIVQRSRRYFCPNCSHKQHQCFVCGELGSSDKSSVAEVFCCSSATCGHFYHPKCVAKLLHEEGDAAAQELQEKIAAGEPFTCPAHKCHKCKKGEHEKVEALQFAICRRCPRSYHRKCLPSQIVFWNEDNDEDVIARAWNGLLPKSRALLYCLKHKIDAELGTPLRNLKFPDIGHSKKQPVESLIRKKEVADSDYTSEKGSFSKSQKTRVGKFSSAVRPVDSSKKRVKMSSGSEPMKRQRVMDNSKKLLEKNLSMKSGRPNLDDDNPSLGSRLDDYIMNENEPSNSKKDHISVDKEEQTPRATPLQTENRILALMKDAASSISLDKVIKRHLENLPSTHANLSNVDRSIILARVEGSVEAVHLALRKLDGGCSIEDAIAVCEPSVLHQLMRWKDKLRVYLAPFLYGMRYTSFGRHFTKPENLEEIVDRLCWYVENGDTIVDFCCGANDFSCLMKKRLDEMGKSCFYRNFDISRPKNDFCFEKRDWMKVLPKELPDGSKLIMGLNPPFGKNASLANRFIDQALRFKPKLVILIVPTETKRLDRREKIRTSYDLVWEDANLLAGKSFYFPGSVDANDKQVDQWNNTAPPLYLWSRSDWTSKYIAIAQQHGHVSKEPEANVHALDLHAENHELNGEVSMPLDNDMNLAKDGKPLSQGMHESYSHYNIAAKDPFVGAAYGRPDGGSFVSPDGRIRKPDAIQFSGHERDGYNRQACIEDIRKYGMDPSSSQRPGFSSGYKLSPTRMNNMRGPGPGVRMDSSSFAPGPPHPFLQQSSSGGWLNE
ncbi:protein ENHANCED DOWNY MILDEW 2-like [Cynara cardunculus var. scolymus]|uniref:protein ENHANCED DOWNY MILDEW 2-like n=1 Tax=Cynara cardunculus var. scolymus TaxID=59895 RepID=UPI000D624710|nr:protein ENHANCED DOWNY MILDEW 2-like [Cynara cardunculus var. scolymus]